MSKRKEKWEKALGESAVVPRIKARARTFTPAQKQAAEARRVDAFMAAKAPKRTAKKTPTLTPAQVRSQEAAARREKVEPSFISKLRKALKGK